MTMLEENELSVSPHFESSPDEKKNHFNENEKNFNKEINKNESCSNISDTESSERTKKVDNDNDIEVKDGNHLKDSQEDNIFMKSIEKTELLHQLYELDDKNIREELRNVSDYELFKVLKEIESTNSYLAKENEVYEFILNDDEMLQSFLGKVEEVDSDIAAPESFELTYSAKCFFAKKKLEYVEKALKQKNDDHALEFQNLNFEHESLNKSFKDLKESEEKFTKNIRINGRHPVTKKIILQKVAKYFDDSIRNKMDLTNRYKIQIQGDIMEQNKILSQIKAQEKRLAFLDMTEFQEAQFEYKKSCRDLAECKEKLGKYKAKFSLLLQKISKLKENLEKEEKLMEEMKDDVIKLEHKKKVMLSEKNRIDKKISELKAAMRKIKLDPRRHNLPEVIDYAAAKRENAILTKSVAKWEKKVQTIQQEKLLQLSDLTKKSRY